MDLERQTGVTEGDLPTHPRVLNYLPETESARLFFGGIFSEDRHSRGTHLSTSKMMTQQTKAGWVNCLLCTLN